MLLVDPVELARRQLARDIERTREIPGLFEHKRDRMRPSALAFLRGSASLFYELLKSSPDLAAGPRGSGWLVGDLHLENFGAYRPTAPTEDEHHENARSKSPRAGSVVFNLNDFDDSIVGPWRFDVLRLMVSFVLGSRELRLRGTESVELCEALLDAYARGRFREQAPRPVAELVEAVHSRTRKELLDARTRVVRGRRELARGEHFRDLSHKIEAAATAGFGRYAEWISARAGIPLDHFEVLDLAYRIAGTGSLGLLRVALLVRGKGGIDGCWLFDMKEQAVPSGAVLLGRPKAKPAKRVMSAMQACLEHPPLMVGTTKVRDASMLVRRLAPQEDKLDLSRIGTDDLEPLARYLGALTAAAHRRGAKSPPKEPWKRKERDALVERALVIAGVHEAAYLAYFKHCR